MSASISSSSKRSFGRIRGCRAISIPFTSPFSITTRSTLVPSRSSPPFSVSASARSWKSPSQPFSGQNE